MSRRTLWVAAGVALVAAIATLVVVLQRDPDPAAEPVEPARILVLSDSLAEGQGEVSAVTRTWPNLLGDELRSEHGLAPLSGGTWLPASTSGELVPFPGPSGVGESVADETGVPGAMGGGPLTWQTSDFDAATVYVAALEAGVEFTATTADAEPVTFTSTGAGPARFEVPTVGSDLTVTGDGVVLGVLGRSGEAAGVSVYNLSWSGSSTSDWLGRLNSNELLPLIDLIDPDLVVLSLGGNDYWTDATPQRFDAHLRRIHDLVAAMAPDADWMLGTQPLPEQTDAAGWSTIQGTTTAYAVELGVPLLDLHTAMPSVEERPELYSADRIHLTDAGHAFIADAARAALPDDDR